MGTFGVTLKSAFLLLVSAGLVILSTSCGVPFRYYPQAALGQMELFNRARPIKDVIRDARVPERVRELLGEIPAIKAFGESQGLKATSNYVDYVGLDRPAVVWVVSASPELKFDAKRWNFPLVGGFTYVGWFSRDAALQYAQEVRNQEGLDVDVRGAGAYSTLGWLRDPVLSTMIPEGVEARAELVNVILHESVHATFYINHQSAFNESLASFVADRLTADYFSALKGKGGEASLQAWVDSEKKAEERRSQFHLASQDLEKIYGDASLSEEKKRAAKAQVLDRLREGLNIPQERTLNNATLIQYRTYFTGHAEFATLFDQGCSGSWKKFWEILEPLRADAEKRFERRQREDFGPVLTALVKEKGTGSGSGKDE
jgi:predicted aminopeptidase